MNFCAPPYGLRYPAHYFNGSYAQQSALLAITRCLPDWATAHHGAGERPAISAYFFADWSTMPHTTGLEFAAE